MDIIQEQSLENIFESFSNQNLSVISVSMLSTIVHAHTIMDIDQVHQLKLQFLHKS